MKKRNKRRGGRHTGGRIRAAGDVLLNFLSTNGSSAFE